MTDLPPSVDKMREKLERENIVIKKFQKYNKKVVRISLDQGGS